MFRWLQSHKQKRVKKEVCTFLHPNSDKKVETAKLMNELWWMRWAEARGRERESLRIKQNECMYKWQRFAFNYTFLRMIVDGGGSSAGDPAKNDLNSNKCDSCELVDSFFIDRMRRRPFFFAIVSKTNYKRAFEMEIGLFSIQCRCRCHCRQQCDDLKITFPHSLVRRNSLRLLF